MSKVVRYVTGEVVVDLTAADLDLIAADIAHIPDVDCPPSPPKPPLQPPLQPPLEFCPHGHAKMSECAVCACGKQSVKSPSTPPYCQHGSARCWCPLCQAREETINNHSVQTDTIMWFPSVFSIRIQPGCYTLSGGCRGRFTRFTI